MTVESWQRDALRVLRATVGRHVDIVAVELLAHARGVVARLTLDPALPGIGSTVIVKRRDSAELRAFESTNLRTEQRALDLLQRYDLDVAPRLLAGSAEAGMLLLTDVGLPVETVLFGADPDAATSALVAMGVTTGHLHCAPIDDAAFAGVATWTIATRDDGWPAIHTATRELGLPSPSRGADVDHDKLLVELREPAEALALVHGDLGPNNAARDDVGTCRLVDFEGAAYQHVGLDAAMLRFPFAWYGRWAQVPGHAQTAMEDAYLSTLAAHPWDYDDAMAVGCMAMAVLRLERLDRIADPSQPADLAFRRRVQIVSTIDVAISSAVRADRFVALTAWLEKLGSAIRARWDEARQPPPLFPAFAGPGVDAFV